MCEYNMIKEIYVWRISIKLNIKCIFINLLISPQKHKHKKGILRKAIFTPVWYIMIGWW